MNKINTLLRVLQAIDLKIPLDIYEISTIAKMTYANTWEAISFLERKGFAKVDRRGTSKGSLAVVTVQGKVLYWTLKAVQDLLEEGKNFEHNIEQVIAYSGYKGGNKDGIIRSRKGTVGNISKKRERKSS